MEVCLYKMSMSFYNLLCKKNTDITDILPQDHQSPSLQSIDTEKAHNK